MTETRYYQNFHLTCSSPCKMNIIQHLLPQIINLIAPIACQFKLASYYQPTSFERKENLRYLEKLGRRIFPFLFPKLSFCPCRSQWLFELPAAPQVSLCCAIQDCWPLRICRTLMFPNTPCCFHAVASCLMFIVVLDLRWLFQPK